MTDCKAHEALLAQYVADGQPPLREYQALRRHLATCEDCRAAAHALQRVEQALWAWPLYPAPTGLVERTLANIDGETPMEPWKPLPWSVWLPALTLLVALALALLLAPEPGLAPAVPWLEPQAELAFQVRLPDDPALLWALWIGGAIVVFGAGITMALVQGRLPNETEMDHLRHMLSDTAQRLWRLAGR
jgi:anti-sigma factor RsiW